MKWISNNDNVNKYDNNRHISIKIFNSEKIELLEMNIDYKVKFAHEL